MTKITIKKILTVLGALTALFGTIPVMRDTVSFRKITVRVYNSVEPKWFSGKSLFKDANNIWVLGKNNFDKLERLPVAFDTDKRSNLQLRIAAKTEAVQLWR
jgi:hypothetical protein